jgi:hypothetical protein
MTDNRADYKHNWYLNNPDKIKETKKRYKIKLKTEVISYYSNGTMKCICCGESHIEFLTINHDKGGGNKHRKLIHRLGDGFWRWLRKNNYPKGYSVMCYNCNCCIGHNGYCPHKVSTKLS